MSLFQSLFGKDAAPANPNPTAPAPGTPTPPANVNTDNKTDDGTPVSPLDNFKDLWQPAKTEDGKPDPSAFFQLQPEKLNEIASKLDFSKAVSPDTLKKISAGGEEAAAAFLEAMNNVGKLAVVQSIAASNNMSKMTFDKTREVITGGLGEQIRNHAASEALRKSIPEANHEAFAPLLEALKTQFAAKYPKASAEEIATHSKDYLDSIAKAMAANSEPSKKSSNPNDVGNWMELFGGPSN